MKMNRAEAVKYMLENPGEFLLDSDGYYVHYDGDEVRVAAVKSHEGSVLNILSRDERDTMYEKVLGYKGNEVKPVVLRMGGKVRTYVQIPDSFTGKIVDITVSLNERQN